MEVGVGHFRVTHRRYLELEAVGVFAGHGNQAFSRIGALVRLDDTHLLEGVATGSGTIAAGRAAAVLDR